MKKLILTVLITSALVAGTILTKTGLVSKEALSINDINITNIFKGIIYTPTNIPAVTLTNPVFKFVFSNVDDMNKFIDNNAGVYECKDGNTSNHNINNWKLIANNPNVSGAKNNIISFIAINGNVTAVNDKKYIIADGNSNISSFNTTLGINIPKNTTGDITVTAGLYSGNYQTQADKSNQSVIANIGNEFTGSITKKFSKTIDASQSFQQFSSVASPNTDTATIEIDKHPVIASTGVLNPLPTIVVSFDKNTSKFITGYAFSGGIVNSKGTTKYNDYNITYISTAVLTSDTNTTLTLTAKPTSSNKISNTVFSLSAYIKSGNNVISIIPKTAGNAGQWTIYGYNAQIPNVASTKSVNVTMKFTNRSSLPTNIYFTLIDPQGHTVSLNSVDNPKLAALPAGTTGTYTASELVSLIPAGTTFNHTGSFSIEVSIPTTPSDVYGFASFKNRTLGQFKDLPIYNNSNRNY